MGISPAYFAGIGRNFMLPREQWCKGAKAYFNTTSFHGKQMLLLLVWGAGGNILYIRKLKFSKFYLKSASDETAYNTIGLLINISNALIWQNNYYYYYYWSPLLCWKLSTVWSNRIMEQFHCLFAGAVLHIERRMNPFGCLQVELGSSFFPRSC